jgi:hypothetical protein
MTPLPRWKCHKEVRGAKIEEIREHGDAGATFILHRADTDELIELDLNRAWIDRFKPHVGGYLVIYDDGYHSFSPGKQFEEGYRLIDDPSYPEKVAA